MTVENYITVLFKANSIDLIVRAITTEQEYINACEKLLIEICEIVKKEVQV